jgi:DNA-binding FadR family transcriptional regulator
MIKEPEQLADALAKQLTQRIRAGEWPLGGQLPSEPQLAREVGVSRGTVREAVRALTRTGVLEIRRGHGTYVVNRSETGSALRRRVEDAERREAFELRRGLEVELARLAALRRTDADLDEIETALRDRAAAERHGDDESFVAADLAFHTAVAKASHNRLLTELYQGLAELIADSVAGVLDDPEVARAPTPWHEQLVEGIAAGDPEAAVAATVGHIDGTITALRRRSG